MITWWGLAASGSIQASPVGVLSFHDVGAFANLHSLIHLDQAKQQSDILINPIQLTDRLSLSLKNHLSLSLPNIFACIGL